MSKFEVLNPRAQSRRQDALRILAVSYLKAYHPRVFKRLYKQATAIAKVAQVAQIATE